MRIATWNINSLPVRVERLEEWLGYAQPDILCLQETKIADAAFPEMAMVGAGYEVAHHGEGRWNGVAILSRVGIDDVQRGASETGSASSQVLSAAKSLSANSSRLKREVSKFLNSLHAA